MLNFVAAVRQTLRLLGDEHRGKWVLLILLALAVTGFETVGAMLVYAMLGLISSETTPVTLPLVGDLAERFSGTSLKTLRIWVAALVAGFFFVRAGVNIVHAYIQARIVYNVGARLSTHLIRGYLALPYLTHTQLNSSELVRNAFDSVQTLIAKVIRPAMEVITEFVMVVGLSIVLLIIMPEATLFALAVLLPVVWVLMAFVQPRIKRLGRRSQDARRATLQAMQQALGGVRDIRLLGREEEFARAFARQRRDMARAEYLKLALAGIPRALIETTLILVITIVFTLAVVAGESPEKLLSTLGIFAYAALRLQPSLRHIVQGLNHIRFGTAIIEDLLADRERVDAALRLRHARGLSSGNVTGLRRAIELRDVTFSYASGAVPALHGVDLTIRKGEFLGICGPTGGGKSTLVDLVAGLLQPTSGEVLVDGRALDDYPTWWYGELGVVSQSVYLMDDTLRRNIAFGQPDDDIDNELLQRSVARAQLGDVIEQLPRGLDTKVGERGVRLSGGQRQRVAVARALYAEPSVIIFDEGTSALDAATEAALVAAVDELKAGRTLISVAHRISTVRRADRIVVVNGGRIVAEGTYEELLHRSELFRSLAR